jgi:uncharacterized protein (DUF1501 family)
MLGRAGVTTAGNPFTGVSVGSANPPASFIGPMPNLGLTSIDGFTLSGDGPSTPMAAALRSLYAGAPAVMAAPAQAVTAALGTTKAMAAAGYTPANGAVYPATTLGKALRDVARLIKGNVGLITATVDFGDWDMHEGLGTAVKGQRMYDHLTELALALDAFATDLGPAGMGKVTLLTLSEFGRRVAENGSRGADHGHGNAMLLLGAGVRGGKVYGTWPGLAPGKLVAGDLAATTDYRSVIGEVLQRRCGFGALTDVFPGVKPTAYGLTALRN